MDKLYRSIWIFCLLFLVTGCWDQNEIEERGFVIGAAIDMVEEEKGDSGGEMSEKELGDKYKLTYQFVVPGNFIGGSSGGGQSGGGASEGKPFLNLTAEGTSIHQITRKMAAETSRKPYLEHINLIVLSEELARKGYLKDVMDFFVRDHEMRRVAKVMVAEGEASKVLEINPQHEKMPVLFIDSLSENMVKHGTSLPPINIGDVHSYLLKGNSFVIPRIVVKNNKGAILGATMFDSQDQKMIGTLNESETLGLNFITEKVESAVLEFLMNGQLVAFEIKDARSKIKADVFDKDQIKFTVKINVDGNVGEVYGDVALKSRSVLSEIEEKTAKEIERIINGVIDKVQKKYKADVFELGAYLKQEHYKTWKQVNKEWEKGENYFSKSVVDVQVRVDVRQIGASIKMVK
ncbi:Ger(x)C family spore germination protein [Peribacillus asahii]|uniref:Ger(X)C family spore germination protein n=1 Tax=Peribacillus asahii TaxID=228899 RepID=A0A398B1S2_9BACI|nr:Ger(x)C family spore germination protein [Peribacillus asahii]RID81833.1 Ger(x)C family spore germination protein [Peribacillus asahii]